MFIKLRTKIISVFDLINPQHQILCSLVIIRYCIFLYLRINKLSITKLSTNSPKIKLQHIKAMQRQIIIPSNIKGQSFFDNVYQVVRLVPKGRVTSYGAIAQYLGAKGSARMVGYAMNAAHTLPDVPAQRVVNRQGLLTGKHHFPNPDTMQKLLGEEGVRVENDKIVDFKNIFWNPSTELI